MTAEMKLCSSVKVCSQRVCVPLPAFAQEGHPLTGTWTGDWKPTATEVRHVTVALEWDGKNVTGTINPGPNAATIEAVSIDFKAWTVRIEAVGKTHIVIAGRIENPGSADRVLQVTWSSKPARQVSPGCRGSTRRPPRPTRASSRARSSTTDLPSPSAAG